MKKFTQILSFVGLCLCASPIFASSGEYFNDEEIKQARTLGSSNSKVENFFSNKKDTVWFSLTPQEYSHDVINSLGNSTAGHGQKLKETVAVMMANNTHYNYSAPISDKILDINCGYMNGKIALFPILPYQEHLQLYKDLYKDLYKEIALPHFDNLRGTIFYCCINIYGNTSEKFLVLDVDSLFIQDGESHCYFLVDAAIKFAKKHTNAQNILFDTPTDYCSNIAKHFGFKEDKSNSVWSKLKNVGEYLYILKL